VTALWTLLGLAIAVAWIVALVDIVKRRRELTGAAFAAWVIIVVLLPFVGTILYFVVGRRS
jgi:Phospholipase_D-nuclease N-terminal